MRITKLTGRRAVLGVATIAVAGASITAAQAHIPGVGNGGQLSTDSPDLRSVAIDAADLRRVKFCFDQPLNGAPTATGFYLQTYDAKRFIRSTSASISATDQSCIQAIMGSAADIGQGTIGSVATGVVADSAGRSNLASTEPLGGSLATPVVGHTTGPDLDAAAKDLDSKTIVYTFDEVLDATLFDGDAGNGEASAADFSYVNDAGFLTNGASLTHPSPTTVRVTFAEGGTGGTVAAAVGAFSQAGAVRDGAQSGVFVPGTPLTTPSGVGAVTFSDNTARTKLVSAVGDGTRQLRLTYSNPVKTSTAPGRIVAVLDDGTSVPASSIETISQDTVRATFQVAGTPDINVDPTALVRVVDRGAAVATNDSDGLGSLPATVGINAPKDTPGFTNGPDLLSTAYDGPGSRVNYSFDENLTAATGSLFFVTAQSGSAQTTTGSAVVNGGVAAVTFGTSASTSIAAGGAQGAATDPLGNPSPQSSAAYAVQPPAVTPPPTTTPPVTPTTKRAKFRTGFSSFKIKSRTRYSGRISSSGRGCKSGRRIALKRSGRTIRNGFTKGDGTFSIARSSGTRGKKGIYVVVTERSTSTTTCTARGSKKLKKG